MGGWRGRDVRRNVPAPILIREPQPRQGRNICRTTGLKNWSSVRSGIMGHLWRTLSRYRSYRSSWVFADAGSTNMAPLTGLGIAPWAGLQGYQGRIRFSAFARWNRKKGALSLMDWSARFLDLRSRARPHSALTFASRQPRQGRNICRTSDSKNWSSVRSGIMGHRWRTLSQR